MTFGIHQIVAQGSSKSGDSGKSPRHLIVEDTPDEFEFRKPDKTDKSYDEFLSFLYRRDKVKSKVKREIKSGSTANDDLSRGKRMLVFR